MNSVSHCLTLTIDEGSFDQAVQVVMSIPTESAAESAANTIQTNLEASNIMLEITAEDEQPIKTLNLRIDYDNADSLANASREDLISIPTVGPKIADSVIAFFRQKDNRRIIEKLRQAGVKLKEEAARPKAIFMETGSPTRSVGS